MSLHFLHPTTAVTTIYVPPIIFDRNAHLVSHLVRVADLFWAGAGLSDHYRTSTICPLTSIYSLPLSLVDFVRGSGCIGICANVDSYGGLFTVYFFLFVVLYSSTVYHGFNGLHGVHERERGGVQSYRLLSS
jgi:hypothetical protein